MIEKDVAHIGQVDPLAERRGRHNDAQDPVAKHALDQITFGCRNARVIKRNLADGRSQFLGNLRGFRARVTVRD